MLFLIAFVAVSSPRTAHAETGIASWYSSKEACGPKTNNLPGCPTAHGDSIYALEKGRVDFCASNDYPFHTKLKVTSTDTGASVVCIVLDRGNFKKYGRAIDLSKRTFVKIADVKKGTVPVEIQELKA